MNTVTLTDEQFRLVQAILLQTNETRSCLSVAEQLGVAYDEDGTWNAERADQLDATFLTLLPAFNIGEAL